jgi:toxin ParE1/3/4
LKIEWTEAAKAQLLGLDAYLYERSVAGADRIVDAIFEAVGRLEQFPFAGRPGRVAGTRELVVTATRYLVAYRARKEVVQILAVMHGAQRWPRHFSEKS